MVEEDALLVRDAVAIGIAEQGDAVALAGVAARCCPGLDKAHDDFLRPLDRGCLRCLGFHDQNVAVRERVERTRMLQTRRQWLDLQALRHLRGLALLPADNLGDVHRR